MERSQRSEMATEMTSEQTKISTRLSRMDSMKPKKLPSCPVTYDWSVLWW